MITPYYQQELYHLKQLALEFSKAHPALAPLLSGPSSDPDVERLLEGTAFLSGLIREKLDDEFPEIVHNLLQLVFPHYLRPIPSVAIVQFTPKTGLMESLTVKAGTMVASIPVNGTKCLFSTCQDVDLHPLKVQDAALVKTPGQAPRVTVTMELAGPGLDAWHPRRLRFLLGGVYSEAAERYHLLMTQTRSIRLRSLSGGSEILLPRQHLSPVGFTDDEALFPYPSHAYSGYRILQEYFIFPHKFLYFDITGMEQWKNRGEGSRFEMIFELANLPAAAPNFHREHFVLAATPVVNLFSHGAEPILLDHRQPEYRIRPSDQLSQNYQVYAVTDVTGFASGTVRQKKYVPFEMFMPSSEDTASYHVNRRMSALDESLEFTLSVAYPADGPAVESETLSVELTCTNFRLPETLHIGDIRLPTESTPGLCEFANISRPTAAVQPPVGKELLWRLLSHISLNYLPIADAKSLNALLQLYIFQETRDRASVVANTKRVDSIQEFTTRVTNRIVAGHVLCGQELNLSVHGQNFASTGDMYLFGSVLDAFLAGYSSLNTFTRLTLHDIQTGERYQWPMRVGDRPLI